jgi:hypothetical protein
VKKIQNHCTLMPSLSPALAWLALGSADPLLLQTLFKEVTVRILNQKKMVAKLSEI